MSVTGDIKAILEADYALGEILAGGVHAEIEISRQLTPTAFDENSEIQPCALVKYNENKAGPHKESAQGVLSVFLYQRSGLDSIEAAGSRIYFLLDERHENGIWQILFASETMPITDDALNCPVIAQRYNVFRSKL